MVTLNKRGSMEGPRPLAGSRLTMMKPVNIIMKRDNSESRISYMTNLTEGGKTDRERLTKLNSYRLSRPSLPEFSRSPERIILEPTIMPKRKPMAPVSVRKAKISYVEKERSYDKAINGRVPPLSKKWYNEIR